MFASFSSSTIKGVKQVSVGRNCGSEDLTGDCFELPVATLAMTYPAYWEKLSVSIFLISGGVAGGEGNFEGGGTGRWEFRSFMY